MYFEDSDDGKTWVMCDKCLRWLHAECAGLDNINNLSTPYECIKCKKVEGEDVVNNNKRGIQMNRNTSGKNVERRKTS